MKSLLLPLIALSVLCCAVISFADDRAKAEKDFTAAFKRLSEQPNETELRELMCWDRVPDKPRWRSQILAGIFATFSKHPQEIQVEPLSDATTRLIQLTKEKSSEEPNINVVCEVKFTLDPPEKTPRTYQVWPVGSKDGQLYLINYVKVAK